MCTVSVIPTPGGFRLACNRDEMRTRPAALPPRLIRFGVRLAVLPLDPAGGGTWVAANDAGVAFALLNLNEPSLRSAGRASRGLIIPALLGCDGLDEATAAALKLPLNNFSPFRLAMIDATGWAVVRWDGARRDVVRRPPTRPVLFTSSGLGDAVVEGPRRRLFNRMLLPGGTPAAQDAFHRHRWPDRPHLSVNMSRSAACTVSCTVVEAGPERMRFAYQRGSPGGGGDCHVIELELQSRAAA